MKQIKRTYNDVELQISKNYLWIVTFFREQYIFQHVNVYMQRISFNLMTKT